LPRISNDRTLNNVTSAERRQLTVMFCDLAGSTALAGRLDPEELREVIGTYHVTAAEVVAGFEGFVAKYMGDGILIYFGYPQAHEDDAERAARAGLALVNRISRLNIASGKLVVRVGIATGLVVVGDLIGSGEAQERGVVGETPNLAARLQTLAEPDAVVIAAGTRRLVGDLFEYRDLGAVKVKGMAVPVQAWQVLRPSLVESRFEALRGSTLTWLVGRDEEIDLLLRRWAARAKGVTARLCWSLVNPGSASRASSWRWRSAFAPSRIFACAISARQSSGQRSVPLCRAARPGSGVPTRRSICFSAGEARNLIAPRRAARRGCGAPS